MQKMLFNIVDINYSQKTTKILSKSTNEQKKRQRAASYLKKKQRKNL